MTANKAKRKSKKAKKVSLNDTRTKALVRLVEVPENAADLKVPAAPFEVDSEIREVLEVPEVHEIHEIHEVQEVQEVPEVQEAPGCNPEVTVTPETAKELDSPPAPNSPTIKDTAVSDLEALPSKNCSTALSIVLSGIKEADSYLDANLKGGAAWIWSLRAPLFLLGAIALSPKLILLWIFIVLAKPVSLWLYSKCPGSWKRRFVNSLPAPVRRSSLLRDLSEGADQGLPFILFWLYLFCAPFAIVWIGVHWIRGFFQTTSTDTTRQGVLLFPQNKRQDAEHADSNFYYSRAFGLVLFLVFALGIPSFISYSIYEGTGLDEKMAHDAKVEMKTFESAGPRPVKPMMGSAGDVGSRTQLGHFRNFGPQGMEATAVMGYNGYWPSLRNLGLEPTKFSTFFVHLYLVSLASVLCMLFFRAWFLFPLNFITDDHDVEITDSGVKRTSMMRGWFLSVITFNRWAIGSGADSLEWSEVKSLRRMEEGFFKLCPLPETAFKRETLTYKLLNKLAAFIDGVSNRPNARNYLVFSSSENRSDFGKNIKINLNDLSREQRARLFYAVKTWAPHVVINQAAEEQLLGSTVLRDNRYTQLWFDILTSRTPRKKENVLSAGDSLKGGEYIVESRISSGGQATTYKAKTKSGETCVLKEFILSTSSTSGAMIESAREFEAEVSLLSQLNHDGIVRLQDYFCECGRLYVVLEYIEGQSLRQKVQNEGPLSEKEVIQIADSICEVLGYLHNCNPPIVHRDITPENILVEPDGKIKIIDFSLAVRQDGRQTTDSCAKQAFTPPEQFREEVCVQSDIYALGATMHFLLTGKTPKPISSSSPKLLNESVSAELNAVVERATQLELVNRYESVDWVKVDLANACRAKVGLACS